MARIRPRRGATLGLVILLTTIPGILRAEDRLPGHAIRLQSAFGAPGGFLARCRALGDAQVDSLHDGARQVSQQFRVLSLVVGSTHGESTLRMEYPCRPGERPITKSEVVLWFGRYSSTRAWIGTKALLDTDYNLYDADRAADRFRYENRPSRVAAAVKRLRPVYVLDEALPIEVFFTRDAADSIPVWCDLTATHIEVFANDEQPLERTSVTALDVRGAPSRWFVGPCDRTIMTQDITDWYDWLGGRDVRSFTVVWRGEARVGDANATPTEFVAGPVVFSVRDPATLAWGSHHAGLACGLVATRDSITEGEDLDVDFGLRFHAAVAPESLRMLHEAEGEMWFTFTNARTGESIVRRRREYAWLPRISLPEDFVSLRERPVILSPLGIALLTPDGEQIPEGTYSVTAWYENQSPTDLVKIECGHEALHIAPSSCWKGRITSAPIQLHVRRAEPVRLDLRVNSAIFVREHNGRIGWGLSAENPLRVTVTQRPGYFVGRKFEESFAIGDDSFQEGSRGWGGSVWDTGNGITCRLVPEQEARIRAGERLVIRHKVIIFETSSPPGHMWMPERGDYRVIWQGSIQGELAAGQAPTRWEP